MNYDQRQQRQHQQHQQQRGQGQQGGQMGGQQGGQQGGQMGAQQGSPQGQQGAQQREQQGAWGAFANVGQPMQQITEVAIRSTALIADLQIEAMRTLWQAQSRGAAMFGAPDVSTMFGIDDERVRRPFSTGAEQLITTVRRATETFTAVTRDVSRLAEQQTTGLGERVRREMESFTQQAQRGFDEIQQSAEHATGEAMRAGAEATADVQQAAGDATETLMAGVAAAVPRRGEQAANRDSPIILAGEGREGREGGRHEGNERRRKA